jgi:hypothetical protein
MLNEQEVEYLKEIYHGRFVKEITKMINEKYGGNHNTTEITNAKVKYGLQSGIKHQFKKGNVPHNKGKKWEEYTTPEVREKILKTTYKKGHIPSNVLPVGTEKYKENYIRVKVAEPNVWRKKHVVIWEQAHGKVPKGHRIMFADGNKFNVTLENLLLVSTAELLQLNRNGMIKEDRELTKTCLQIVKLNKKLNERGLGKIKKSEYNKKYMAEYRKNKKAR